MEHNCMYKDMLEKAIRRLPERQLETWLKDVQQMIWTSYGYGQELSKLIKDQLKLCKEKEQ